MSDFRCEACGASWPESAFCCPRCGDTVAVEVTMPTPVSAPAWLAAVVGPDDDLVGQPGVWRLELLAGLLADIEANEIRDDPDPCATLDACRELRVMYAGLRAAAEAEIAKARTS